MTTSTHKRATRQRQLLYARACGVSGWVPRQAWIDAAQERTEGMVSLFMHHGAKASDLPILVRSAYLQGAQDAAMVATKLARTKESD